MNQVTYDYARCMKLALFFTTFVQCGAKIMREGAAVGKNSPVKDFDVIFT